MNREAALHAFLTALSKKEDYEPALIATGCIMRDIGNYRSAMSYFDKVLESNPDNQEARINNASIYRLQGNYSEAIKQFDITLKQNPGNPEATAGKAMALFQQGEIQQAKDIIVPLSQSTRYDPLIAQAYSEICKNDTDQSREALRYTEATLRRTNIANIQRAELHFSAARHSEKLAHYKNAFDHARLANSLSQVGFNQGNYTQRLNNIKETYATLSEKGILVKEPALLTPIFIVGMPRSGSSLTEQILSCHSRIYGAGEITILNDCIQSILSQHKMKNLAKLNPKTAIDIAISYQKKLSTISNGADFVTDKLPGNLELIGLISLIMPHSKIVITQRDKLDTCLSCYFQNFGTRHPYSTDLANLDFVYEQHLELVEYWLINTNMQIYTLHYENLVCSPRLEIQKLLDFLQLPFETACLDYHLSDRQTKTASFDQVRQPLHTASIEKWRHYQEYLNIPIPAATSKRQ